SDLGSVYFPGVAQLSQAQVVPVKAGEEAQADIAMRRVKTVEIAGRVIGASGPAARTMVRFEPAALDQSDFSRDDTTDEKGNFRLRNIPGETYYVLAYQPDAENRVYEVQARQKVSRQAQSGWLQLHRARHAQPGTRAYQRKSRNGGIHRSQEGTKL